MGGRPQKDSTPQAAHELLLWLIPQIDKFPRVRRFTLGERLESALLEVLELAVEAAFTHNKRAALQKARKEYRKRGRGSGRTVYDDPRVAVGPGVSPESAR